MFLNAFSDFGRGVDSSFLMILVFCLFILSAIAGLMALFIFKYRKAKRPVSDYIPGNRLIEASWTILATISVIALFTAGLKGYEARREPIEGGLEVKATGQMWSWSFEYGNGKTSDVLGVPAGRPVNLRLESNDLLHSLYMPAFRLKEDLVPGMPKTLSFVPAKTGRYDIYCAEYCGQGHSAMLAKVEVMEVPEFNIWLTGAGAPEAQAQPRQPATPKASQDGAKLLAQKGCTACHSLDGKKLTGPTLKGLYGSQVTVIADGKEKTLKADEEYLKRAITDPNAEIVKGYQPMMQAQKLSEAELEQIVEYIKTLK